jgi:hypothetical protein
MHCMNYSKTTSVVLISRKFTIRFGVFFFTKGDYKPGYLSAKKSRKNFSPGAGNADEMILALQRCFFFIALNCAPSIGHLNWGNERQ